MAQSISGFISRGTPKHWLHFDSYCYCIVTSNSQDTSSGLCLANHLSVNLALHTLWCYECAPLNGTELRYIHMSRYSQSPNVFWRQNNQYLSRYFARIMCCKFAGNIICWLIWLYVAHVLILWTSFFKRHSTSADLFHEELAITGCILTVTVK